MALHDRQQELHEFSRTEGARKARRSIAAAKAANRATQAAPTRQLLTGGIEELAGAITTACSQVRTRGPAPAYVAPLRELGAPDAALITLRHILDRVSSGRLTVNMTSKAIGKAIEDELICRAIRTDHPYVWRRLRATGRLGVRSAPTALKKASEWSGMEWAAWPPAKQMGVGRALLQLAVDTLGIITIGPGARQGSKKRPIRPNTLLLTPHAAEWLERQELELEALRPLHMPMVEPPADWVSMEEGGDPSNDAPLVRGRPADWYEAQAGRDLSQVCDAVNALQRTPWAINEDVLATLEHVWAHGWTLRGVPSRDPVPIPEAPEGGVEPGSEAHKRLRVVRAKAYDLNREQAAKRVAVVEAMRLARLLKGDDALYFPMHLDWRSRIYTVATHLSPQGMDVQRALLTFAEARPLTTQGAWDWLKIHGANCAGEDKASYADRCRWVDLNETMIRRHAADPLTHTEWTQMDKPFSWLAFCFDYVNAIETGSSSLPIAMDGTCSGLQHYSALLLDEAGGRSVNLVPLAKPADVYSDVAHAVTTGLEAEGSPMARQWLSSGLLDRKLCKQPVMTTPYGVTPQGVYEQIDGVMVQRRAEGGGVLPFEDDSGLEATQYIVPKVRTAIASTVEAAGVAMVALRGAARELSKQGTHAQWITPVGFHVLQHYHRHESRRVNTILHGSVLTSRYEEATPKLDRKRAAAAIAPNVIHSLDAAHLMRTVNAMTAASPTHVSFAMIHDSFGCHAADAPLLARTLRKEFVRMYSEPVLADLMDQLRGLADPEKLADWPETPEQGSLDLQGVLESDFFFA